MKKNIGILFPLSLKGGVFQYALSIIDSLIDYSDKFKYTIFHNKGEKPNLFFSKKGVSPNYVAITKNHISPVRKILHFLNLTFGGDIFLIKTLHRTLKNTDIDLLIIPTPFSFSLPINVPYIVSVPDYMHKYYPRFPEYTLKNRLTRDIVYKYYASRSVLVVTDSKQGISDLHKFSNIKKEKIRTISYIPPSYIYRYKDMNKKMVAELLSAYRLPEKFLFYPAQFWFQKNHARLIKALHLIKEKHKVKIPLVLVGSAKGSSMYERIYKEIVVLIEKLDISEQVIHLGYVGEKELVALYKKAIALIAPPFQGPTTIPPLEAMVLGTPVVTVNLFEVPKQVGNAALLFNPLSIEDIADKAYRVWQDEELRQEMIKRGYEKTKNMTQENYAKKWEGIIEEALIIINYEKP
jgi:glycosyltransferase involved in cell wall biosynthesis